jgi:hypothetical protein
MQLHDLFTVVSKTPSATTAVANAFAQPGHPKPGNGVCSAVGSGGPTTRGVLRVSPTMGGDEVSTKTRQDATGVGLNT